MVSPAPVDHRRAFEDAVARNQSCTLSVPAATSSQHTSSQQLRSRLLAREPGGGVWVEWGDLLPAALAELAASKAPITVGVRLGKTDLLFASPVLKWKADLTLNDQTVVPAVMLAEPKELVPSQRRATFRVPVAPEDDAAIRVWKLNEYVLLRDRPVPSQELKCDLLELSAGGAKVRVHARGLEALRLVAGQRLRVDLRIGKVDLTFEARIRYPHATARDDEVAIVGISFESFEKDVEARRQRGLLERFLGDLQRTVVRKVRRKAA